MKIKYYCPVWGMKHLPLAPVLQKIKASGYDGAEIALDPDLADIKAAKQLFDDAGLGYLAQLPYPKDGEPEAMLKAFLSKLEALLMLNPVMVNCHTGKDYFTFEQNVEFIKAADGMGKAYGITIAHETHRGRFSFSPVTIEKYLDAVPDMKLTADFSHWCVVSESLLENMGKVMDKAVPHCVYIHARVGYAQGPQVPNPAAPEYANELLQHMAWWQRIVGHRRSAGADELIITPEFGPVPYMQTMPFTNAPLAGQYEVNLFMKDYLSKHLI